MLLVGRDPIVGSACGSHHDGVDGESMGLDGWDDVLVALGQDVQDVHRPDLRWDGRRRAFVRRSFRRVLADCPDGQVY